MHQQTAPNDALSSRGLSSFNRRSSDNTLELPHFLVISKNVQKYFHPHFRACTEKGKQSTKVNAI
jgi:hypothetical protein